MSISHHLFHFPPPLASACSLLRISVSVPPLLQAAPPRYIFCWLSFFSSSLISKSFFLLPKALPSSLDFQSMSTKDFLPLYQPFLKICPTAGDYCQVISVSLLAKNVPDHSHYCDDSGLMTLLRLRTPSTLNSSNIPGPHTILPFVSSCVPSTILTSHYISTI